LGSTDNPLQPGDRIGSYEVEATSNPVKYDTDGDGLSDYRESRFNRDREIKVATTPESAKAFREAERNNESDSFQHLSTLSVGSSPLLKHSDSDGIPDGVEAARGLAPSDPDTDQDGIPDDVEAQEDLYPRLHDFRPPKVRAELDTNGQRTRYRITLNARDPSGVGVGRIIKGGQQQDAYYYMGTEFVGNDQNLAFSVDRGFFGNIGAGLSGYINPSKVNIEIEDVHENSVQKEIKGPNNLGKVAEGFADASIPWVSEAGVAIFAPASGLADGISVLKNDLVAAVYLAGSPSEYDDAVIKAIRSFNQLKNIVVSSEKRNKALSTIVRHYGNRRSQLNPFDDGSKYQDAFAFGYSLGYASSYLIPIAAEEKAAQLAAKAPYIGGLIRSVGRVQSSIKGALAGSAMWTGGKIARRIPSVDFDVGNRIRDVDLSGRAKRVVGQTADAFDDTPLPEMRRVSRLFERNGDSDLKEWLTTDLDSTNRLEDGLTYLSRTGQRGWDLLSGLGDGARQRLLRLRDNAALQRQMTEAWASGDAEFADIGRATERYDALDSREARNSFENVLEAEGPDAVTVTGKLPDGGLETVLDADLPDRQKADAIRKLSDADNTEAIGDWIGDGDSDTVNFIAESDSDTLDTLAGACRAGTSDVSTSASTTRDCLSRSDLSESKRDYIEEDPDANDFLDAFPKGDDTGLRLYARLDENQLRTLLDNVDDARGGNRDLSQSGFAKNLRELSQEAADGERSEFAEVTDALATGEVDLNSPYVTGGVPQAIPLRDLATDLQKVGDGDLASLARGMEEYGSSTYDDFSALREDINRLNPDNGDPVTGLGETIESGTARDGDLPDPARESNFKGMAGEIDVANNQLDRSQIDLSDITLQKGIGSDDIADYYESNSRYDLKKIGKGRSDIDVDIVNGVAIESKNRDYIPTDFRLVEPARFASEVESLRKKLETIAASGEDNIVVATKADPDRNLCSEFSDTKCQRFLSSLGTSQDYTTLREMANIVEEKFNNDPNVDRSIEITFKSYESVGESNDS
jgi:hypothetical protein